MKKFLLLIATMFSLSTTASFAQEQGDDNGFGLKLFAGFYNKDKYGYTKTEAEAIEAANDVLDFVGADGDDSGVKNIPLLGLSIDNRWYVANPGKCGIAIDARWLDLGIAKQKVEDVSEATHIHAGLLMPGVIGTFYLGNEMAIDAFYNVGAMLAVSNGKNLVSDTDIDASFGLGLSQFVGAAFRYKVFQVGFEYNIAKLKTMDWGSSSDDEDSIWDSKSDDFDWDDDYYDLGDFANDVVKDEKVRRNNFRVFLGFKF